MKVMRRAWLVANHLRENVLTTRISEGLRTQDPPSCDLRIIEGIKQVIATMMRVGSSTARRALIQTLPLTRSASSPSSITISQLAAFSTCNVHRHSNSPSVRQEHQQTTPPSSAPIAYQSFRPDPNRRPVSLPLVRC